MPAPTNRVVAIKIVEQGDCSIIDALMWAVRYLQKYEILYATETAFDFLEKITKLDRGDMYMKLGTYKLDQHQGERFIAMVKRVKEDYDAEAAV